MLKDKQLRDPARFLAFGFGGGLAPRMPGTVGTVIAIPLFWVVADLPIGGYLGCVLLAVGIGIWVCDDAARYLGVHDDPSIVWDEITGYLVTMIGFSPDGIWWLLGFLVFRAFDIGKPWPISWADRHVCGGFGIMLDDILAGLMACATLHALQLVLP